MYKNPAVGNDGSGAAPMFTIKAVSQATGLSIETLRA